MFAKLIELSLFAEQGFAEQGFAEQGVEASFLQDLTFAHHKDIVEHGQKIKLMNWGDNTRAIEVGDSKANAQGLMVHSYLGNAPPILVVVDLSQPR
jgi:hypothetical protein